MAKISSRRFVYTGTTDDIKAYVYNLGFLTEDYGPEDKPVAFTIVDTTIKVGYHGFSGMPNISMLNDPAVVENEPEKAERSTELYEKLYRRFRTKRTKE